MKDTLATILLGVLLFVVLPLLILWTRDRINAFRRRRTPSQIQAGKAAYRERLLHPKPEEVEEALAGKLPQRLIALYSEGDTLQRQGIEVHPPGRPANESGEWIEEFLPLDMEGQIHTCDLIDAGWGKGFNFAADGCGNFYWVPIGDVRLPDAPVFFACHDPWGNEKVANSLEEFLSWPRVYRQRDR